eukprot:7388577-Prymnesium_polylepis.1
MQRGWAKMQRGWAKAGKLQPGKVRRGWLSAARVVKCGEGGEARGAHPLPIGDRAVDWVGVRKLVDVGEREATLERLGAVIAEAVASEGLGEGEQVCDHLVGLGGVHLRVCTRWWW